MKRIRLLTLLLFVSAMACVFTNYTLASVKVEALDLDSDIRKVTVFRNGAQVTRTASVTLPAGRSEIIFTGLTPSLNPQTIQLSGSGDFLILSLAHRKDYLVEHPQRERLQQLTVRRDSLERLIRENETARSILDRELSILLSNTTLKGERQNLSTVELKQAMEYFHQKLTDLEMQKLRLSRDLEEQQEELQKLRNQISELDSSAGQNKSVITAVLQSQSAGQVQFMLSYLVSEAGWYPSYDLRVGDIDGPVNFSYKANIYQSSGVDWDDVTLSVTSAVPDQGGVLPQLRPWFLRFYTPQQNLLGTSYGAGTEEPAQAKSELDDRQRESGTRAVPVREIQNRTSFTYRIDLPYSVPSGAGALTVEIGNHDIPADYRYYTIPKLNNRAYLTARINDWDRYNLLAGDANLFFENTYVGKSAINPRSVGDTLSFSLGRDESLVIQREKLREFEEKNFFGSRVRETFAWEISVRNSKDQSVRIEVEDQVPVSQHEDIKISLNEDSGAGYNPQTGILHWPLQIAPGETESVRFEYEVEYPRGRQVTF